MNIEMNELNKLLDRVERLAREAERATLLMKSQMMATKTATEPTQASTAPVVDPFVEKLRQILDANTTMSDDLTCIFGVEVKDNISFGEVRAFVKRNTP